MLDALVLFMAALPLLAAAVPQNPEIKRVLKAENARLYGFEG